MNVGLFIEDAQLAQVLIEHKHNKDVALKFFTSKESLLLAVKVKPYHSIVLTDRGFSFTALCEFVERLKEQQQACRVIILLTDESDTEGQRQTIKYALSQHLLYILPGQSRLQIANELYRQILGFRDVASTVRNNIVLFLGSTPNIGTTVVAYSTALQLAKQSRQHIAYICLNLKSSKIHRYMGIDAPARTLDSMRTEIKTRGLTAAKLRQYAIASKELNNFHVLLGNLSREQAEFYTVDDIQHVLDIASEAFDLCIVEVNAYWDNAATIGGILFADSRIIVSTNQLGHFQEDIKRWLPCISAISDLKQESFDLFITQIQPHAPANSFQIRHVRKETGMNIIGKMYKLDRINELLNEGRINDLAAYEPQMSKHLEGLITMLSSLYRLEEKGLPRKKTGLLFNRL